MFYVSFSWIGCSERPADCYISYQKIITHQEPSLWPPCHLYVSPYLSVLQVPQSNYSQLFRTSILQNSTYSSNKKDILFISDSHLATSKFYTSRKAKFPRQNIPQRQLFTPSSVLLDVYNVFFMFSGQRPNFCCRRHANMFFSYPISNQFNHIFILISNIPNSISPHQIPGHSLKSALHFRHTSPGLSTIKKP